MQEVIEQRVGLIYCLEGYNGCKCPEHAIFFIGVPRF